MFRKQQYTLLLVIGLFCSTALSAADQVTYQSFMPADKSALENLRVYAPGGEITIAQLKRWDEKADELSAQYKLPPGTSTRLQSYLYNAQLAFAKASKNINGNFAGSLDPISIHVLTLFFPQYTPGPDTTRSDRYSKELTKLIAEQVDERFRKEQEHLKPYAEKAGKQYWTGTPPYAGIQIPSLKTWCLERCDQFRCPEPAPLTEAYWQLQLDAVKKAMRDATPKQKEAILYWAGINKSTDGDWIWIANEYMENRHLPLEKRLLVRSLLSSTMHDATIAVFDSKYTYWVKRPNMLDSNLKTVIETPNHPSYPSGHSTISAAAADVLVHFFPENKVEWERKAEEAGHSRIWAGLHYPIDHEAGAMLGHKVAWQALNTAPAY